MKEKIKNLLKKFGVYYFLQGRYRNFLSEFERIINKHRYSNHVLEHIPDDYRAMREFYRVL